MKKKLSDSKFPLNQKEFELIFSNLDEIIKENSILLQDLEDRLKNWYSCQTIGDVFCDHVCMLFFFK